MSVIFKEYLQIGEAKNGKKSFFQHYGIKRPRDFNTQKQGQH